jgi:Tfp pilus assembly protein PilF
MAGRKQERYLKPKLAGLICVSGSCVRTTVSIVTSSDEAMSLLEYLSLVNGSPEKAKSWFDRAIEEDPSYAQPHIGYGDLYGVEKNYRKAKESYDKALELKPESFHAWL